MIGVELIAVERKRQIEAEGWTPEHDDGHTEGELVEAAIRYAYEGIRRGLDPSEVTDFNLPKWPWDRASWKPSATRGVIRRPDAIRNLAKAGALIAAEIDRLQREK